MFQCFFRSLDFDMCDQDIFKKWRKSCDFSGLIVKITFENSLVYLLRPCLCYTSILCNIPLHSLIYTSKSIFGLSWRPNVSYHEAKIYASSMSDRNSNPDPCRELVPWLGMRPRSWSSEFIALLYCLAICYVVLICPWLFWASADSQLPCVASAFIMVFNEACLMALFYCLALLKIVSSYTLKEKKRKKIKFT